ncbi:MAG: hypothetical protein E2600_01055 [Chryseobacterium sp.]|nr:hypothetical protein [Chryseobacterium sp.]
MGKFPACYGSPTKGNNTKQKERPRITQAFQLFFPCYFEKFGRISVTGFKAKRYILNDFISNYYIILSFTKINIYIMNPLCILNNANFNIINISAKNYSIWEFGVDDPKNHLLIFFSKLSKFFVICLEVVHCKYSVAKAIY